MGDQKKRAGRAGRKNYVTVAFYLLLVMFSFVNGSDSTGTSVYLWNQGVERLKNGDLVPGLLCLDSLHRNNSEIKTQEYLSSYTALVASLFLSGKKSAVNRQS